MLPLGKNDHFTMIRVPTFSSAFFLSLLCVFSASPLRDYQLPLQETAKRYYYAARTIKVYIHDDLFNNGGFQARYNTSTKHEVAPEYHGLRIDAQSSAMLKVV